MKIILVKKLMTIIFCLYTIGAQAQLYGAGSQEQWALKALKTRTDTVVFASDTVFTQRYSHVALMSGIPLEDNRIKMALLELEDTLNGLKKIMIARRVADASEVGKVELKLHLLKELKKGYKWLDITSYEEEYAFYKKHLFIKTHEEIESALRAEQAAEEKFNAEDPHTITDLDRELANRYEIGRENSDLTMAAVSKITKIANDLKNREADSIAAIEAREQEKARAALEKKQKIADEKNEKKRRADLIAKYGAKFGNEIANGGVMIGMTREMCIAAWGEPLDINRTTFANVTHEQWVYNIKSYLYFDNGKLTAFQN